MLTADDEVTLYNAIVIAERYVKGLPENSDIKQAVEAAVRVCAAHGFAHGEPNQRSKILRTTLREALANWTDFDGSQFEIAKCLGLMPDILWNPGDATKPGAGMKGAFWTNNLFSTVLDEILQQLVKIGAVDVKLRADPSDGWEALEGPSAHDAVDGYRWRTDFDWERAADSE
jgi:hypothetical protein